MTNKTITNKALIKAKEREKMHINFNPLLLKASQKFLDDLERECKQLNKENSDSLKEVRILQEEISEIMQEWEV
tara:strand:+ start:807 stop:1028 length:222 start_codon:yes stop_codon:yes gene_type:complete